MSSPLATCTLAMPATEASSRRLSASSMTRPSAVRSTQLPSVSLYPAWQAVQFVGVTLHSAHDASQLSHAALWLVPRVPIGHASTHSPEEVRCPSAQDVQPLAARGSPHVLHDASHLPHRIRLASDSRASDSRA